jgi:hypothetical protein
MQHRGNRFRLFGLEQRKKYAALWLGSQLALISK